MLPRVINWEIFTILTEAKVLIEQKLRLYDLYTRSRE
jgi:hypothetical protein